MATSTPAPLSPPPAVRDASGWRAVPVAAAALAVAVTVTSASAAAGQVGNVELLTRADGRVLPVHERDGRKWVVGTPGQEYAIRVCNTTGGRVLAVMSVDGVNVVSGDTASPAQSGYVLDGWQCAEINGWRKSLASIAAFYFTELPDSYAARTGRPDNVGVIGVALFRERAQPIAAKEAPDRLAASPATEPVARQEAAAGAATAEGRADVARKSAIDAANMAPAPMAKIGTGHGRNERSYVQTTRFERESAAPNETIAIHYDRRENLIAMGILPPPAIARAPNPFPSWTPQFVPDPPRR
jgi:hypothetical protein